MNETGTGTDCDSLGIAVIGMAGRFPGANNIDSYWKILLEGKETIEHFSEGQLKETDAYFELFRNDPKYVKARGIIENLEYFDAEFFGYSPKDAAFTDPQHRLWLECAWEALENAGYDPERYGGLIGVFGGGSFIDSYLLNNICRNQHELDMLLRLKGADVFSSILNNSMGFLPTQTAYKLNLKGPCINVQTACSTSLVAVCLACQCLINYDADICLAGGVSILIPQEIGYHYEEGGIPSPDGHCRPFDASANGTVISNGLGIVVLKRLQEAIDDRDNIMAVIKGWGVNNDGSRKLSFSAPSVTGQAGVISMAHEMADIDPSTITYIEAHGTGTRLGDPVEVAALTKAFRNKTKATQFCGIGSVKGNIGHLDAASGVAGLIKAILSLNYKKIPPSINFKNPNPEIDFENSPFYVVNRLIDWKTNGIPRRCGVSSFGIGGTNAHVVIEEPPPKNFSENQKDWQLVILSAKTASALDLRATDLIAHIAANPEIAIADIAYTLSIGRQNMNWRKAFVYCSKRLPTDADTAPMVDGSVTQQVIYGCPEVVFMFPGQGSEHPNMGVELYRCEEKFSNEVNKCLEIASKYLNLALLRPVFTGERSDEDAALSPLRRQSITQCAIFITEYALAKLWMSWGIQPSSLVGHSIGEYSAACIAGVFSLEDAIYLVINRGRIMETMAPGSMVAVFLAENRIKKYLSKDLSIAVINGPSLCVLSGQIESIEKLESQLKSESVYFKRLPVSHAFHSHMTEHILDSFRKKIRSVRLNAPHFPMLSNITGKWGTSEEFSDPERWVQQLRNTVRFSDCVKELLKENRVFLEVGPGQTLTTLASMHLDCVLDRSVLPSMRHPKYQCSDMEIILKSLGKLWCAGVQPDWQAFYKDQQRRRVPLPAYPFERQRYWVEPAHRQKALNDDSFEKPNTDFDKSLPVNVDIDKALVDIWKDLLGHNNISPNDDFFNLGGNSLIGVRLLSRINNAFDIRIPVKELYQTRTISKMAMIVREMQSKKSAPRKKLQNRQNLIDLAKLVR